MDEYIDLLQQLISCKAVSSDIPAVNKAMDIIHAFLAKRGVHCTMEEFNGRHILYASTQPGKTPKLLLNSHVDVVPASEEGQFEPYIKDGWIYGRGSGDCQGHVVCLVKILCEADKSASIGAIFSGDEEIGGTTTKYMVQKGYIGTRLICIMDTYLNDDICYAEKGILSVRLTAHGKCGHASTPWCYDNPIDKLLDGYMRLRSSWVNPTADDQWHKSMAATMLNAGVVSNQIPDTASMTINFRTTTLVDRDEILESLVKITGWEVEVLAERPALVMDRTNPVITQLAECMSKHLGKKIGYARMNGATDACWFAEEATSPIIILGTKHTGIHGKGEKAELKSIETYAEMWKEMATQL